MIEINVQIHEKNDDEYEYTYNGNCVKECPEDLTPDDNGICIEKEVDLNKCSLSRKNTTLKNFDDDGGLDTLVSNYYEEYYYTEKHVSVYNNTQYDIIIYIQKECLTELNLNFPVIDFGTCYDKVQNATGLNQSLIVVLAKKYNMTTGRSSSSYSLYNPLDGTKQMLLLFAKMKKSLQKIVFQISQKNLGLIMAQWFI